jgi:hypothetical protein
MFLKIFIFSQHSIPACPAWAIKKNQRPPAGPIEGSSCTQLLVVG